MKDFENVERGDKVNSGKFIGVSPAGVIWVAYKPGTFEDMCKNLDERWERHYSKKVKVTGLSEGQMENILGELRMWAENHNEVWEEVEITKTTFEASREIVEIMMDYLEGYLDEDGNLMDEGLAETMRCRSDAEIDFAVRQKSKSIRSTISKLKKAL